ncbi:aquaporin family protein [Mesoplasma syrphidae]|uniref:Aquaporin family protein n=1 Tax=Mesoplasma syrphidae TaxID=225999 RepID=A0A2K9BNH6_9MOLU|nr:MIP/aquaporin family protein [Mesoplasma syrphidae]AUF83593.1 aquaporin family protein [Mesoplasma syrphidae]
MTQTSTLLLTELFGTALLIVLGNGIVANIVLKGTKGNNAGWLSICFGWGFAVTVAALISSAFLGGKGWLNPAVMLGASIADWKGTWGFVDSSTGAQVGLFFGVLVIQFIGAALGQIIVDLLYYKHIQMTLGSKEEFATANVLGMHSTGATTKSIAANFGMEFVGTFILIFAILAIPRFSALNGNIIGGLGPVIVGIVVISIGLSLGGTTGYAINPARDLGPRIVHALMPTRGKGKSDWEYAWIPVAAPLSAAIVSGLIWLAI